MLNNGSKICFDINVQYIGLNTGNSQLTWELPKSVWHIILVSYYDYLLVNDFYVHVMHGIRL